MLDISNYFKDGYTVKIEQYVLVNSDGDELVIQVDHKPAQKHLVSSEVLLKQLRRNQNEAKKEA